MTIILDRVRKAKRRKSGEVAKRVENVWYGRWGRKTERRGEMGTGGVQRAKKKKDVEREDGEMGKRVGERREGGERMIQQHG